MENRSSLSCFSYIRALDCCFAFFPCDVRKRRADECNKSTRHQNTVEMTDVVDEETHKTKR